MGRILIEVKLTTNKSYEFMLDDEADLKEAVTKITGQIEAMENTNITFNSEHLFLCDVTTQQIVTIEGSVKAAEIKSGHTLMLL